MSYYASFVAAILLGTAGQIALKSAAEGSPTVIAQFLNPLTMVGLAVHIVVALCCILAIKKIPVSIAFPSVAASYAAVPAVAQCCGTSPSGGRGWQGSY
jgi:small multidrug resistance pump